MWYMIMLGVLGLFGLAVFYVGIRVPAFFGEMAESWPVLKQVAISIGVVLLGTAVLTLTLNFMNAIVCMVYFAVILLGCDLVFWGLHKLGFSLPPAPWVALGLTVVVLMWGWYLNHQVKPTSYMLTTQKQVSPLKIVMIADVHLGTTFNAQGFQKHLEKIQGEKPDAVVIVGDFVDDRTTRAEMLAGTKALSTLHTPYGVYFVFGNHDAGYEPPENRGFTTADLVAELEKNNVHVLQDKAVPLAPGYTLIGRADFSRGVNGKRRLPIADLVTPLDRENYQIVLDHQPRDYTALAKAGVDLVLSGHTHGGQLFPMNGVGKWLKMNDMIYGYERRKGTDFIVSSGISSWAIKFKTGTKSEYVVIEIKPRSL